MATNSVGPPQNITSKLIVRYGSEISVPRPRIQQAPGYEVVLQCRVDSFPTSALDWKKDGEIIKSDNHFYVAHFNKGPTSTLTTLRVRTLVTWETLSDRFFFCQIYGIFEADYGSYQCLARNALGNDTQTVELLKTQIPIPEAAFAGTSGPRGSLRWLVSSLALTLITVTLM